MTQAFGEASRNRGAFKKDDPVWLCYTGDNLWRLSRIVEVHETVPEFEVLDYDKESTIRVGVDHLKRVPKDPF